MASQTSWLEGRYVLAQRSRVRTIAAARPHTVRSRLPACASAACVASKLALRLHSVRRAQHSLPRLPAPRGTALSAREPGAAAGESDWRTPVAVVAVAMLLCNVDRSLLSTAVVHIAAELRLDSLACGVLQSAYLWGYGLGQLPSGLAADRFGGPNTLLAGLALWSLATAALPAAAASPAPFAALLAARALFGLGSAAALPATSASVAQLVPPERRAGALSTVYALFNVGSVLGLSSSGPLTHALGGWQGAFWAFGAVGLGWATVGSRLLRAAPRDGRVAVPTRPPRRAVRLRSGGAVQLAALLWCHSVIGFGYFLLLSWIPTYLRTSMALQGAGTLGLLSSLPWAFCAAVGLVAGGAADALSARGVPLLAVRTAAHAVATLGPAAAIAALPLCASPAAAVACLCVAVGCQALNYAGFHAHAGTAGGRRAGLLLAVTNSGGIAMGIAGNVAAGALLQRTGSFDAVFAATAALYLSSLVVWLALVRDEPIFVEDDE